jgi:ABC-2 type transport system permease protein
MVNQTNKKRDLRQLVYIILGLIAINYLATYIVIRFDLTSEKRYSLTKSSVQLLQNLDDYVYVKCYLTGTLPGGFQRLENATTEMLQQFSGFGGKKFQFEFINPQDFKAEQKDNFRIELEKKGITPIRLNIQQDDNFKEQIAYPWCLITYKDKEVPVFILNNQMGKSSSEQLNNSIALLEYNLVNGINKAMLGKRKKIAITEGHGELSDNSIADFMKTLYETYDIARVNLSQIVFVPNQIDALIIPKPTKPFTEQEKFKLDQYIMNGGKVLWMIDAMNCDIDSLRTRNSFLASDNNLELDNQLFTYGVRINKNVIQDMYCAPIPLVTGVVNGQSQTDLFPWPYFPVLSSTSNHSISKNLDAVLTLFPSSIDTVGAKEIKKTILLQSSQYSRILFSPLELNLRTLKDKMKLELFNKPYQPVAVLLEGSFTSVYENRLAPATMQVLDSLKIAFKAKSEKNKMIVISDGDIAKNPIGKKGIDYPCGYYPFTKNVFANKSFLLNCIQYLTADNNIIESRSKEMKLRLLNGPKVKAQKMKWQIINIICPLLILFIFAFIYLVYRNKKYN